MTKPEKRPKRREKNESEDGKTFWCFFASFPHQDFPFLRKTSQRLLHRLAFKSLKLTIVDNKSGHQIVLLRG